LFPNNEEVELSWQILDPVIKYWQTHGAPEPYSAGTWGPTSADKMLEATGRRWRRP
jgi:glucose-6-phosphate 1-dehydrogenase